jgi:[ribosomal protein S18]-alanine N-acetyltransferase
VERAGVKSGEPLAAIELRRAAAGDAAEISVVAQSSPGAASWSEQQFLDAISGNSENWVAVADGDVAGFLFARVAADEAEILNMGVTAAIRRRKVGARLLDAAVRFARARGAKRMFLEVRESNGAAIAFYRWAGFKESGQRPRYYSNPTEDARLLTLNIK